MNCSPGLIEFSTLVPITFFSTLETKDFTTLKLTSASMSVLRILLTVSFIFDSDIFPKILVPQPHQYIPQMQEH